jgi:hypothetical protein
MPQKYIINKKLISETMRDTCKLRKRKHFFLLSHRMSSDNTHHKYLTHHVKIEKTYAYFLAQVNKKGNCLPIGYLKVILAKNLPPNPVVSNQRCMYPQVGST